MRAPRPHPLPPLQYWHAPIKGFFRFPVSSHFVRTSPPSTTLHTRQSPHVPQRCSLLVFFILLSPFPVAGDLAGSRAVVSHIEQCFVSPSPLTPHPPRALRAPPRAPFTPRDLLRRDPRAARALAPPGPARCARTCSAGTRALRAHSGRVQPAPRAQARTSRENRDRALKRAPAARTGTALSRALRTRRRPAPRAARALRTHLCRDARAPRALARCARRYLSDPSPFCS